jgi:hypothetical protein
MSTFIKSGILWKAVTTILHEDCRFAFIEPVHERSFKSATSVRHSSTGLSGLQFTTLTYWKINDPEGLKNITTLK